VDEAPAERAFGRIAAFEGQRPGGRGWAESPATCYSFETSQLKALLNVGEAPV
jgi:hypothetical protein